MSRHGLPGQFVQVKLSLTLSLREDSYDMSPLDGVTFEMRMFRESELYIMLIFYIITHKILPASELNADSL